MTTTAKEQQPEEEEREKGVFQIHYFASAASFTQKQSEALPAPLPLRELFPLLESRYPGITQRVLRSCSVSVGLEYVDIPEDAAADGDDDDDDGKGLVIQAGEEVGIIPPVSSG